MAYVQAASQTGFALHASTHCQMGKGSAIRSRVFTRFRKSLIDTCKNFHLPATICNVDVRAKSEVAEQEMGSGTSARGNATDEERYRQLALEFSAPLSRLARGYEADPELRRDLLQEIHLALWVSLRSFDGRCSLRTWVYRIAHNVSASHIHRRRRERGSGLVSIEDMDIPSAEETAEFTLHRKEARKLLIDLVGKLKPLDRQILLLYLEEVDAATIGEVTGMSPGNVSTKLHRIRQVLIRQFHQGV